MRVRGEDKWISPAFALVWGATIILSEGRTVLVQLRDSPDPETGERYTVKRYESEKVTAEDGTWRHLKITLKPNNPDFQKMAAF